MPAEGAGPSHRKVPASTHPAFGPDGGPPDLYIGGKWLPAGDGRRFDVITPAAGDALASVADAGVPDALAAVEAAHAAGSYWATTAPRDRAEILRRVFELMTAQAEEYARLISLENGKALPDSRGEVAYAAEFFRWYAEGPVRLTGTLATAPSGATHILATRHPVGECVLAAPRQF